MRRTVSGPTHVQAEARREVKLAEIAAMLGLIPASPFDLVKAPRAKRTHIRCAHKNHPCRITSGSSSLSLLKKRGVCCGVND